MSLLDSCLEKIRPASTVRLRILDLNYLWGSSQIIQDNVIIKLKCTSIQIKCIFRTQSKLSIDTQLLHAIRDTQRTLWLISCENSFFVRILTNNSSRNMLGSLEVRFLFQTLSAWLQVHVGCNKLFFMGSNVVSDRFTHKISQKTSQKIQSELIFWRSVSLKIGFVIVSVRFT